jgi:cytochrome c-type biogenesis protein CcmH
MRARLRPALAAVVIGIMALPPVMALGWLTPPALALTPEEILPDPALEARARALSKELRCMVCQNQSIDDSDATLARDLRVLVRERLAAGDSDQEIIEFLVTRYGEFVLLRPRLSTATLALWAAPGVILLAGGFFLWRRRKLAVSASEQALSADEQAQVDAVLRDLKT